MESFEASAGILSPWNEPRQPAFAWTEWILGACIVFVLSLGVASAGAARDRVPVVTVTYSDDDDASAERG